MSRGKAIGGKRYKLVVLRAVEWDEQGRPSKVIVGYDDTTFDLSDDKVSREFWTCYVPDGMLKRHTKAH